MGNERDADLLEVELVLGELDRERRKFSQRDPARMSALILWLIREGEYREPIGTPHKDLLTAIEYYGAFWHRFDEPLHCPRCKADLRDHEHGPPFKREIGLSNGDSIRRWRCPDCGKEWPR